MSNTPHFTTDELHATGTPAVGWAEARSEEERSDIPPMMRRGMPLYDPSLFEEPAKEDDPNVVDGEVVDPKKEIGTSDKGTTTTDPNKAVVKK